MRRLLLFAVAMASMGDAAVAQNLEGRLKQISETKVVKLAHRTDAKPFSFVNMQGQPDGYTVDLCKFVVHSLELQLDAKLTIAWVPVDTQCGCFRLGRHGVRFIHCFFWADDKGRLFELYFHGKYRCVGSNQFRNF